MNEAAVAIAGSGQDLRVDQALDGLDLVVETGEVHGFLGPNGSGKTTTIRVLLGLLRADGGEVTLLGGDPWRDAVALHRRLAYVPGDVTLWPKLTGGEVIDLLGRLRGDLDPRRRDELLERFELDPTKKARTYSKGNRQKVGLVAALASRAELLILDEPTSGLDPLMEAVFQDCIREVKAEGRTVLLSSHILAEVEALCDRVSIIRAGRTEQSGTLQELRGMTRTSITAELDGPPTGSRDLPGVHGLRGRRHPRAVRRRHRAPRRGRAPARRARRAQPGEPPADARGAVPPPLRRRARARSRSSLTASRRRARDHDRGLVHRRPRRSPGSRCGATGCASSSGSRAIVLLVASTVASVKGLYPNQAELDKAARGVGGQRGRDHLQRTAAGPRHGRRPGRVPDRRLRA